MSENGETKKHLSGQILRQLEDHIELASLELNYETERATRRVAAAVVALVMGVTAYAYLQWALVLALSQLGWNMTWVCLGLGLGNALLGTVIAWRYARRDPRVGPAFQGTREELIQNLRWIQKFLS